MQAPIKNEVSLEMGVRDESNLSRSFRVTALPDLVSAEVRLAGAVSSFAVASPGSVGPSVRTRETLLFKCDTI